MLGLKRLMSFVLFIALACVVSLGQAREQRLIKSVSKAAATKQRVVSVRKRVMIDVSRLAARQEEESEAASERTEKTVTIHDTLIPVFIVEKGTRAAAIPGGYAFSFDSGPTSTIKFVFPATVEGGDVPKIDDPCECDAYQMLTREDGQENDTGYTIVGFSKIGSQRICNKIIGTDGNDTLIGGDYQDTFFGGEGWDTIEGGNCGDIVYSDGNDDFQDFSANEGDVVKSADQWAVDMGE